MPLAVDWRGSGVQEDLRQCQVITPIYLRSGNFAYNWWRRQYGNRERPAYSNKQFLGGLEGAPLEFGQFGLGGNQFAAEGFGEDGLGEVFDAGPCPEVAGFGLLRGCQQSLHSANDFPLLPE